MSWDYGFFNSVNGDRLYNAETMNSIFDGLITSGVYESIGNKLAVQPNSGMVIQIATGRGWFNKHWVNNTSEYLMTLDESDVVLNRYCAICIRVDDNDSVRTAVPYLKYSEYATTPTKPTMVRTESINEYCLAYVYISAGATEITASDIEDTRFNTELCGWVTGLIEQLTTTTLYDQWQSIFYDWFNDLVDNLNENTEAMLVNALPTGITVNLVSTGWTASSDVYTQSVNVTAMNTTKSVVVSPASNLYGVKATSQGSGTITFTADALPDSDIPVEVLYMGV